MAGAFVTAEGFGSAVAEAVAEFFERTDQEASEAVAEAGEATAALLRSTSPKDEGEYARGWKADVRAERFGEHEAVVHQAAKPGLTHLLENGHAKFTGGKPTGETTPAIPHIEPAYEHGSEVLRGLMGL
ncbi:hypothetical protein GMI70_02855 [Eggerthellaceae bacterium zg-893]|nr:hypothetical protein [Eggerthellaceae bacterium zg-893]